MILVTLRSVIVVIVTIVVVMAVVAVAAVAMMTVAVPLGATPIRVSDFGEVLGSGTDMKLFKHLIGAFVAEEFGHAAVLIPQVTENDRVRGTSLTARRNNRSVCDGHRRVSVGQFELPATVATAGLGPRVLGLDSFGRNALGAIGAFLHDTSHANRHFGIQLQPLQIVRGGLLAWLVVVGLNLQDATFAKRIAVVVVKVVEPSNLCLLYTSPSPRDTG